MIQFKFALLTIALLILPRSALAQSSHPYVPAELEPWTRWIEEAHPEWQCPTINGQFSCSWPARLTMEISEEGAKFIATAELWQPTQLALPGAKDLLPHNISISRSDGKEVNFSLVVDGVHPALLLDSGKYKISGDLKWAIRPREIPVPVEYGLLDMQLPDGEEFVREGETVRIFERAVLSEVGKASIRVVRRLADGSPMYLDTLIEIRVSGDARSMNFGKILPTGVVPYAVESQLPYQLSAEGELSLQARPGSFSIMVRSALGLPRAVFVVPTVENAEWPLDELWIWQSNQDFRSVEIIGGSPTGLDLIELPEGWKHGAAYRVSPAERLEMRELRRGLERAAENNITLNREFWLDIDGSGLTVLDTFSGSMNQGFRLDSEAGTSLGRANVGQVAQLITKSPINGKAGIELRDQTISVSAVSRIAAQSSIAAVGWATKVDSLAIKLNLAPGWRLLHVYGADFSSGSWLASWSLLDLFIAMIVVLGVAKLFNRFSALLLAVLIVMNHAEFLEPRMLFNHLLLALVLEKITLTAPEWLRKGARYYLCLTAMAWTLQILAFSKLQFTQFLFPQLQSGTRHRTALQGIVALVESNFLVWPVICVAVVVVISALAFLIKSKSKMQFIGRALLTGFAATLSLVLVVLFLSLQNFGLLSSGYRQSPSTHFSKSSPIQRKFEGKEFNTVYEAVAGSEAEAVQDARPQVFSVQAGKSVQDTHLVQSGPAVPVWRWRSSDIVFSGPVQQGKIIKLFILSPAISRVIALLRVILVLLLGVIVIVRIGRILGLKPNKFALSAVNLCLFSVLLLPGFASSATAEIPDESLLKQLEERLIGVRCVEQKCATIESLKIDLRGDTFELAMQIASRGTIGIALPGPLQELPIAEVKVDNLVTDSLRRDEKGYLWVRVTAGVHQIVAKGHVDQSRVFTVEAPQLPLITDVVLSAWQVEGLLPTGAINSTLRFLPMLGSDKVSADQPPSKSKTALLPIWFNIKRHVMLNDKSNIITTVSRIGDIGQAAEVKFDMIAGERLLSSVAEVQGSQVVLRLQPGQESVELESSLQVEGELELVAGSLARVSEEWQVECGLLFNCQSTGAIATAIILDGRAISVWKPFPGERVLVKVLSLQAIKGSSVTVDAMLHEVRWGSGIQQGSVELTVRATQQSTVRCELHEPVIISSATVDEAVQGAVHKGQQVSFVLPPGEHALSMSYSRDWEPGFNEKVPALSCSVPPQNLTMRVLPSASRWILWVGGSSWGPAVLFWSKLLFVVLLCLAVRRFGFMKIPHLGAAMLGIGLATLPMVWIALPLSWVAIVTNHRLMLDLFGNSRKQFKIGLLGLFSLLAICAFYQIVSDGLLAAPPMLVAGNSSSYDSLNWFVDFVGQTKFLPQPWVISAPIWVWRAVMLIWSSWLAASVIGWLADAIKLGKRLVEE